MSNRKMGSFSMKKTDVRSIFERRRNVSKDLKEMEELAKKDT